MFNVQRKFLDTMGNFVKTSTSVFLLISLKRVSWILAYLLGVFHGKGFRDLLGFEDLHNQKKVLNVLQFLIKLLIALSLSVGWLSSSERGQDCFI